MHILSLHWGNNFFEAFNNFGEGTKFVNFPVTAKFLILQTGSSEHVQSAGLMMMNEINKFLQLKLPDHTCRSQCESKQVPFNKLTFCA